MNYTLEPIEEYTLEPIEEPKEVESDYSVYSPERTQATDSFSDDVESGLKIAGAAALSMGPFVASGYKGIEELIRSGDLGKAQSAIEEFGSRVPQAMLSEDEQEKFQKVMDVLYWIPKKAGEGLQEIVRLTPLKDTIAEPIAGTIGEMAGLGVGGEIVRKPAMTLAKTKAVLNRAKSIEAKTAKVEAMEPSPEKTAKMAELAETRPLDEIDVPSFMPETEQFATEQKNKELAAMEDVTLPKDVIELDNAILEPIEAPDVQPGALSEAQPPIEGKGVTLTSGIDPTQFKRVKESLQEAFNNLETPVPISSLQDKLKMTGRALQEAFLDPEKIMRKDPKAKEAFKALATAEESKNAFMEPLLRQYLEKSKGLKRGSKSMDRVGMALDGKINPSELNPTELRLHEHLKGQFDFLIKEYARRASGDEATYQKVLRNVNLKEEAKATAVQDLPPEASSYYNDLKRQLETIRNGQAIDSLAKAEKERYWQTRRDMRDILHQEWVRRMPENEAKAYDILSRKIKDYLPHLFEPKDLVADFQKEIETIRKKLETSTDPGTITKQKQELRRLQDAVVKLQNGYMVTYDQLPSRIRFRFFEKRKGKEGYSYDAGKAYTTYLYGLARKMFDEPAVRQVKELYKEIDPDYKAYTKWLTNRYMGWERNPLDWLAGTISSFEWMRTLGLNPRSAIVNLTQRINTVAYIGEKWAYKSQKMMFTEPAKAEALFEKSGIAREVPQVLTEGSMPKGLEGAREVVGFMFNKVERGNRKHAFIAQYLKSVSEGKSEGDAIQAGIKTVHKTQFRYGKLGMPKALAHPVGRVAGQFASYTLKQAQFLAYLMKTDPVALMKWIAYAEGVNYSVKQLLDTDLSNALGFGITWGEVWDSVKSVAEGDAKGAVRHVRLAVEPGGGILPSGPGPALKGVSNIATGIYKGEGTKAALKEITPVMFTRVKQAYDAIKDKQGNVYPVKDSKGHVMYELTGRQLAQRTLGPRTAKEKESSLDYESANLLEQERTGINKEITDAILTNDMEKANKLINRYEIMPSERQIEDELMKRMLPREKRKKSMGVRETYQLQREGKIY